MRSMRIKLNPTRWQKAVLARFNGQCRFTYNAVVASRRIKGDDQPKLNFQEIRNAFVTAKTTERDSDVNKKCRKAKVVDGKKVVPVMNPFLAKNDFLAYTPVSVRQGVVKQYVAAEKAAWTNFRNGNISRFHMNFRSRRLERSWTLNIDKRQIFYDKESKKLVILKNSLCSESEKYKPPLGVREAHHRRPKRQPQKELPSETHMRFFDKIPFSGNPDRECSIHYSHGQYWLRIPYEKHSKNPGVTKALQPPVGIDPGGRDPLVTFDATGKSAFLGTGETDVLERFWVRKEIIRKMLARQDVTGPQRRRLKRQLRRAWNQYVDYKTNLHHQLSSKLARDHSAIFLPELGIEHIKRTLKPKAVRRVCAFGHGLFRTRLREKCWETRTWLPDVDERCTTIGCSRCGGLHREIGTLKVFECPHCKLVMDRDLNSAKNILMKHTLFCAIPPDVCA
jgi:transposase